MKRPTAGGTHPLRLEGQLLELDEDGTSYCRLRVLVAQDSKTQELQDRTGWIEREGRDKAADVVKRIHQLVEDRRSQAVGK